MATTRKRKPKAKPKVGRDELRAALKGMSDDDIRDLVNDDADDDADDVVYAIPLNTKRGKSLLARLGLTDDEDDDDADDDDADDDEDDDDADDGKARRRDRAPAAAHGYFRGR